jgi:hypothetical protein
LVIGVVKASHPAVAGSISGAESESAPRAGSNAAPATKATATVVVTNADLLRIGSLIEIISPHRSE